VLVELMPDEPEAQGLLALMLLTEARRAARVDDDGLPVLLADQDRSRWDAELIDEGHAIVRALLRRNTPGPYQVQAAIAAVHAAAPTWHTTDWTQIVQLYDLLHSLRPNDVVALNRAIALGERDGAQAGLDELDALELDGYRHLHVTRAELLSRLGRDAEAAAAFDRAIGLTTNDVERADLERRRRALT
jgi:RNA polymerase sigma-70 factor (ECF subfamily)